MDFACGSYWFQQSEGANALVDGDGKIWSEAALIEKHMFDARILDFEIGDELPDRCAFHFQFGLAACEFS
jgi:hypothetical protein